MTKKQLSNLIRQKKSFLCVGLDTDLTKIPTFLLDFEDPIFEFNKRVIDATKDYCVAYKPNIAFYEAYGARGWISLEKTLNYIPSTHFTIADAKRGDIGNTSKLYAKTYFETFHFDAVTVSPYMGSDSVKPFLEFQDKWVIILALTSNLGSRDFQFLKNRDESLLYQQVINVAKGWGDSNQIMFVVGATQSAYIDEIRKIVPDHFLLVPGVGKQGGDLGSVFRAGSNPQIGLLVNSSRSIIFAGKQDEHFDDFVQQAARDVQKDMHNLLIDFHILN
jgi:orotidine-5'-phosphate decarboxylase